MSWQTVIGSRGTKFRLWEFAVPQVPEELKRSVVFLYPDDQAAYENERTGGTGFVVGVAGTELRPADTAHKPISLYVVTAAHVKNGKDDIPPARVIRFADGEVLATPPGVWKTDLAHDLAVCPVETLGEHPGTGYLPSDRFAQGVGARQGDDIFMLGRFGEYAGARDNRPMARFGNVALEPGDEPLNTDPPMSTFLVEMRSRGGFSGSPVFLFWPSYGAILAGSSGMDHAKLLGVDHGHFPTPLEIENADGNVISGCKLRENSAVSVVVPVWHLKELLEDKDLDEMRKQTTKDWVKRPRAVADSASVVDGETFTKSDFEDALRKATRRVGPTKKG
jgi:Trypsin-like peptidase domain